MPLVELLPCITLEVIQVGLVVTIAIVLAEVQIHFKILLDLGHAGVGFE
jgi:hypothetical protein